MRAGKVLGASKGTLRVHGRYPVLTYFIWTRAKRAVGIEVKTLEGGRAEFRRLLKGLLEENRPDRLWRLHGAVELKRG